MNFKYNKKTWLLDLDSNPMAWTRGPDMSTGREALTCSFITDPSPQIVIVGGETSTGYSNSVEILNLDNNLITRGK